MGRDEKLLDVAGVRPESGVLDRALSAAGGALSSVGSVPNPGNLVKRGVGRVLDPAYPVDAMLSRWMNEAPIFDPTIGGMLKTAGLSLFESLGGFAGDLARGDTEAALNSSWFPMGGMTVYHGSPHKFDAFDLSKIGTGEGAQAYGHGLYFAENPDVAKEYVKAGRNIGFDNRDGVPQFMSKSLAMARGDRQSAIGILEEALSKTKGETKAGNLRLAIKQLSEGKGEVGLYHVDIPDDEIAKMLDWDKPLSEQPESVRKALVDLNVTGISDGMEAVGGGRIRIKQDPDFGPKYSLEMDGKEFRLSETEAKRLAGEGQGQSIYRALKEKFGGGKQGEVQASEYLKGLGIPGIKYLDGGSRGAGEGSRNLVLFDDKLAKVLKRE